MARKPVPCFPCPGARRGGGCGFTREGVPPRAPGAGGRQGKTLTPPRPPLPSLFSSPPAAAFAPPTVSDTKAAFYAAYPKPLPALYTPVVQELLVQHHLVKFNVAYQYDQVRERG